MADNKVAAHKTDNSAATGSKNLIKASQILDEAAAPTGQWNTKNLGLRLAADFGSAASAAALVAPIIAVIDKSIMENASGRNTLQGSLRDSLHTLVTRPQSLVFSKPVALICMLYGGTYLSANTLDTLTSTVCREPATLVTAGTLKFAVSSTANVGLCLVKDQAFVRLFGPPGGAVRPVAPASFALFALRDCMTVFASFNIPPLLGPFIDRAALGHELGRSLSGDTLAQLLAPAAIQLLSTPLHLLGLDLYNRHAPHISAADRWAIIRKNWAISAAARIARIVPAFGFGGVVNKKMRCGLMERLS
ncbi:MAG: hypothetical protein M1818_007602 [Claussenomyces sp. TS43310]|nr:MAG: hypothetical protein M1818_007602 [Claussenomyces sp. TS43310]